MLVGAGVPAVRTGRASGLWRALARAVTGRPLGVAAECVDASCGEAARAIRDISTCSANFRSAISSWQAFATAISVTVRAHIPRARAVLIDHAAQRASLVATMPTLPAFRVALTVVSTVAIGESITIVHARTYAASGTIGPRCTRVPDLTCPAGHRPTRSADKASISITALAILGTRGGAEPERGLVVRDGLCDAARASVAIIARAARFGAEPIGKPGLVRLTVLSLAALRMRLASLSCLCRSLPIDGAAEQAAARTLAGVTVTAIRVVGAAIVAERALVRWQTLPVSAAIIVALAHG